MFKIDFIEGEAVGWSKNAEGISMERFPDYRPRFYLDGEIRDLIEARPWISSLKDVKSTKFEEWKPTLSKDYKNVLRIDTQPEKVRRIGGKIRKEYRRSRFRFYNFGFSPQFRFCLQKEIRPVPEVDLERMKIDLHRKKLAGKEVDGLKVNGEKLEGVEREVLEKFGEMLRSQNPEILVVNRGEVLELLNRKLKNLGMSFSLGKINRFQKLADENTVSSYGKTVHSNARFNVPGRIVIDRSNSFLLKDATLEGMWGLVARSYRPLQELAWGSIGRLLTSIEVKKAYLEENTLTPWKNWSPEKPKKASTMHKADRGGFIFNPDPGIHQGVFEADFASLFPNIMIEKNISPETVCCDCCENEKVPELGYSICERKKGFIPKVLEPLVEDRQMMKKWKHRADRELCERIQGSIESIKWILVSCFGYMGHSHASYGAIRCHQAIQAFDRHIMVNTKEIFEENGYEVVHGIIDSIWVRKKEDATPMEAVCEEITERIGIELEFEHHFDWVAFVPRASTEADIGTLNRYFGKKKSGGFKTAGIEIEQDSAPEYVKQAQKEMLKAFEPEGNVSNVMDVLDIRIRELEEKRVENRKLLKNRTVSKKLQDYSCKNLSVAGLRRARKLGMEIKPGQSLELLVRDDDAVPVDRVRLGVEAEDEEYDTDFYIRELVRAAESVLSPLGWDREDIRSRTESGVDQMNLRQIQ